MTPSERLLGRLRKMGLDIPEGAQVRRTYAGALQRNVGAWSWFLLNADGSELRIGSQYPVSELLRGRLHASQAHGVREDIQVDPWEPGAVSTGWQLSLVEESFGQG